MDATKFRPRMLLDSGVVIRALEYQSPKHAADPRTIDSRDLWVAALRAPRVTILIAAPTVTEFRVGPGAPPMPLNTSIEYVSFTAAAAEDMATWATPPVIKNVMTVTGERRKVVEYDTMIVACARFARADLIVALDDDVHELAKVAKLPCYRPEFFRKLQLLPTTVGGASPAAPNPAATAVSTTAATTTASTAPSKPTKT